MKYSRKKSAALGAVLIAHLLWYSVFAESATDLSMEDEIRAGRSLLISFQKLNGLSETPESKSIEQYLQSVGDKVARNATRKLPYQFHLDPNPAFRSAVAYPGGENHCRRRRARLDRTRR